MNKEEEIRRSTNNNKKSRKEKMKKNKIILLAFLIIILSIVSQIASAQVGHITLLTVGEAGNETVRESTADFEMLYAD